MATYDVELTRKSIDGHLKYKKKFEMEGDIGGGSSGGVLVVNVTYDAETEVSTCDKTAGEMWAACLSGGVVLLQTDNGETFADTITSASEQSGSYTFSDATGNIALAAATANDYPTHGQK